MSSIEQAEQHIAQGEYYLAEQIFTALTHNRPTSKETGYAYMGLGKLALISKKADQAVELFSQSCEFLAGDVKPLSLLADAFNMANAAEDALTVLNYANQIVPASPQLRYQLAQQQILMGELQQAKSHLLLAVEAIELTHNEDLTQLSFEEITIYCHCLLSLSQLISAADSGEQLLDKAIKLKQLCDKVHNDTGELTRAWIVLNYSLGNLFDHNRDYRQAFSHYQQANSLQYQGCSVSTTELAAYFHSIKTFVDADAISIQSDRDFDIIPIFLLGLPCTGSNLLEQLLVNHRQIGSAGECDYLNDNVLSLAYKLTAKHYPRCISDLTLQQLDDLGELYLTKLKQYVNPEFDTKAISGHHQIFHPEITHIIDRFPENFQTIGLIYKLFPNAKIINMTRCPKAVSWSIYQHYFANSAPHLCCQDAFTLYCREYEKLMEHWRQAAPGVVLDLSYESLVAEPAEQLKRVLTFCQLPFDDTLLMQMQAVISPTDKTENVNWQHYQHFR